MWCFEKGFMLSADEWGVGICKQANSIPNCLGAQIRSQNSVLGAGQVYCWDCDVNFVLSRNGSSCMAFPNNATMVPNCKSYWTNTRKSSLQLLHGWVYFN